MLKFLTNVGSDILFFSLIIPSTESFFLLHFKHFDSDRTQCENHAKNVWQNELFVTLVCQLVTSNVGSLVCGVWYKREVEHDTQKQLLSYCVQTFLKKLQTPHMNFLKTFGS